MARLLALDWDSQQVHVVAAGTGARLRIQHAAVWPEAGPAALAEAAALGQRLRERLNGAGITATGVVACLGRDRVIVKEVRYPQASPADEPGIVRFQAAKELTEPVEDVVIDYLPLAEPAPSGERRAAALIIRKDVLLCYQTVCKAAGLKLAALTPRPFGVLACWQELAARGQAAGSDGAVAVLTIAGRWAEFCVLRRDTVLFSRAMTAGPSLAGEVRRNVAVYSSQWPQHSLTAVSIAGDDTGALREQLQGALSVPVVALDPFAAAEKDNVPAAGLGGFTAAVGLLYAEAGRRPPAINFVQPRQAKVAADPNRRKLLFYGAAAAALLLGVVVFCAAQLAERDRQYQTLIDAKSDLDRMFNELDADARRIAAMDAWTKSQVNWLDELYDMADRIPDIDALRLTELVATAGDPAGRTPRDRRGRMTIKGVTRDTRALDTLMRQLENDGHLHVEPKTIAPNRTFDRQRFSQQFTTGVHIDPLPPNKYFRDLSDNGESPRGRGRGSQGNGLAAPEGDRP